MMKKLSALLLIVSLAFATGCSSDSSTKSEDKNFVLGMYDTVLDFAPKASQPSKEEIENMLEAAVKAPSGLNQQHYWITVITDYDTQMELALTPETRPEKGTVLFIYSVPTDEETSAANIGISYGYLNAQAQLDGYGTHIYSQPARMLGAEGKGSEFGIPEGYDPVEFVLVGKPHEVDGKTAATPGNRESKWNFFEK